MDFFSVPGLLRTFFNYHQIKRHQQTGIWIVNLLIQMIDFRIRIWFTEQVPVCLEMKNIHEDYLTILQFVNIRLFYPIEQVKSLE